MNWKTAFRSFYYEPAADIPEPQLPSGTTALVVIDIQNIYFAPKPPADSPPQVIHEWTRWAPFRKRMREIVIPATQRLVNEFRFRRMEIFFTRIAALTSHGRDRSLSQRRPGFNNLLLSREGADSQIIPELQPLPDEIVITKTTDSSLTGTNLRLVLANLRIEHAVVTGIFTDQCVSSTVRSLADESFDVVVAEDACAAATEELHRHELEIINNIYCQVMSSGEVLEIIGRHNR